MVEDVPPASECRPICTLLAWLSDSVQTKFRRIQHCSSGRSGDNGWTWSLLMVALLVLYFFKMCMCVSYTYVGDAYCRLIHQLFPGCLDLSQVLPIQRSVAASVRNFKLLQSAFKRLGIKRVSVFPPHGCCAFLKVWMMAHLLSFLYPPSPSPQHIPVESLIKGHHKASVEFLQWFRFFYISNCKDHKDVQEAPGHQRVSSNPGSSSATVGR